MMNETTRIEELIRSANAVPYADSLPAGALSSSDLLARIDERNTAMTNTKTGLRAAEANSEPTTNRSRYRGPLIGLATAMAIAAVVLVATALLPGGEGSPVADSPRSPRALPADTPLINVVTAFQARFDAGDVPGYEAIFNPAAGYVSGTDAEASWFGAVTGIVHERDCAATSETQIRCTERIVSGLEPGTASEQFVTVWNGSNGYLDSIEFPEGSPSEFFDPTNGPGVPDYRSWLERTNPVKLAELFVGATMKLDTEEAREGHRGFVPFYLSSTGPRADGALPADTPLLEVVGVFQQRFDEGDIAGYEAIFHPMAGYRSGQDAEASWFGAVTGMQHDRECTLVTATQVRCVERATSGLEPGTTSDEIITLWEGADGYIWNIQFPDGPPAEFSDPQSGPGVDAYRAWVETNAPEVFGELFVNGQAMKLDTEEARTAHRDLVARFLADSGN
jgi:hypothetical protein